MASIRHTDDVVLDAVRVCVLAVGVRRTTLTDVARRAGVSRMTLYRRYPDVDALVRDLMTREFSALLHSARGRSGNGRQRLVATAVSAAAALRGNELFRRMMDVDPELLLPYVVDRLGGTQWTVVEALADGVRAGQSDGSIRDGDVSVLAHTALLLVQPFVYSARVVGGVLDEKALGHELSVALDRYLAP